MAGMDARDGSPLPEFHDPPGAASAGSDGVAGPDRAYDILRPTAGDGGAASTPVVFASPHSGRCYPHALMAQSALDGDAIRRSEDAFVDRLIAGGPGHGATVLAARYARASSSSPRRAWW